MKIKINIQDRKDTRRQTKRQKDAEDKGFILNTITQESREKMKRVKETIRGQKRTI